MHQRNQLIHICAEIPSFEKFLAFVFEQYNLEVLFAILAMQMDLYHCDLYFLIHKKKEEEEEAGVMKFCLLTINSVYNRSVLVDYLFLLFFLGHELERYQLDFLFRLFFDPFLNLFDIEVAFDNRFPAFDADINLFDSFFNWPSDRLAKQDYCKL